MQFRAWDFSRPLLVAPAMNTFMWDSPFTAAQLEVLQKLGVSIIPPVRRFLLLSCLHIWQVSFVHGT